MLIWLSQNGTFVSVLFPSTRNPLYLWHVTFSSLYLRCSIAIIKTNLTQIRITEIEKADHHRHQAGIKLLSLHVFGVVQFPSFLGGPRCVSFAVLFYGRKEVTCRDFSDVCKCHTNSSSQHFKNNLNRRCEPHFNSFVLL